MKKIVDGVVRKIADEFGDDYRIYTETVEQGLQEPCFIVSVKDSKMAHIRGERHSFVVRLQVTYFPKGDEKKAECLAVSGRMYAVLGVIPVEESPLRGSGRSYTIDDDLLHFSVSYEYQFFVSDRREESDLMGSLEMEFV